MTPIVLARDLIIAGGWSFFDTEAFRKTT